MNDIEERIWARASRKCRRCHRTVYKTYKIAPQGVIYHVNRDLNDKADTNLILVCYECLHELSRLYIEYPRKYICLMELIARTKIQSLRDKVSKYDIGYRYYKVCLAIENLEQENNKLVLPTRDQEQLVYLKTRKAKIEAEEIKGVLEK